MKISNILKKTGKVGNIMQKTGKITAVIGGATGQPEIVAAGAGLAGAGATTQKVSKILRK